MLGQLLFFTDPGNFSDTISLEDFQEDITSSSEEISKYTCRNPPENYQKATIQSDSSIQTLPKIKNSAGNIAENLTDNIIEDEYCDVASDHSVDKSVEASREEINGREADDREEQLNSEDDWEIIPRIERITDVPENRMQTELPDRLLQKAYTLSQREFGFIQASGKADAYQVVGTYCLGPNVALVGFCPDNQTAFATHYDIMTKLEMNIFRELPRGAYRCYIVGGLTGYSEFLIDGIFKLTRLIPDQIPDLDLTVVGRCILGSVFDPKSIYIDCTDGQIYTFRGPSLDPDFWNRGNKFTHHKIGHRTGLQHQQIF